jgi:hypothetical protein
LEVESILSRKARKIAASARPGGSMDPRSASESVRSRLGGRLAGDAALAHLKASGELPDDWLSFSADGNRTIVCARAAMTADAAPAGGLTPTWAVAITFECANAAIHVVANGRAVPSRCVCDTSSHAERCVCVGGTLAELAAGLDKSLTSKELESIELNPVAVVLDVWTEALKLVVGAQHCHGLRSAVIEQRLADDLSWSRPEQLRTPPRYDFASGRRIVGFAAKEGCAVLVADSSVAGQQLRQRYPRADEVARRDVVLRGQQRRVGKIWAQNMRAGTT